MNGQETPTVFGQAIRFAVPPLLTLAAACYFAGGGELVSRILALGEAATCSLAGAFTSAQLQRNEARVKSSVEDLEALVSCCRSLDAQIEAIEAQRTTLSGRIARQHTLLRAVLDSVSYPQGPTVLAGSSENLAEHDAVTLLHALDADRRQLRSCEVALRRAIERRAQLGRNVAMARQDVRHRVGDLEREQLAFEVEKTFSRGVGLANRLGATRWSNCSQGIDTGLAAEPSAMFPGEAISTR